MSSGRSWAGFAEADFGTCSGKSATIFGFSAGFGAVASCG